MRLPRLFEREAPRKRNVFKDLSGAGKKTLLVASTQSRGFDFGFAALLGQRGSDTTPWCHSLPRSFKSSFKIRAKRKTEAIASVFLLVRVRGLEPPRSCPH